VHLQWIIERKWKKAGMSHSAITKQRLAVVEHWFNALAHGDFEKMHRFHTDDIVWELMPGPAEKIVPWTGVFRRREGVDACLQRYADAVRSERFETEAPLVGPEDTVSVPGFAEYVTLASGRAFRVEFVEFFRFRGDRIAFVKVYGDTAAASEALASS
jgi:ketosteroid isomerase-like protein